MIALLCKAALIVLLIWNLWIAVKNHGRLMGYIVEKYKEGYSFIEDGKTVTRPPQVFSGHWQRFDSTGVILSTLMYAILLWGAGVFNGG